MGRRAKSTTPVGDFMALVAKLPWWAGVLLAVLFYVAMQAIATQPSLAEATLSQGGMAVPQLALHTLATLAQYVLPFLCLGGAGMSAWHRLDRKRVVKATVAPTPPPIATVNAVDSMNWPQFERLVVEVFRRQGYHVAPSGGQRTEDDDDNVDFVLTRCGETHLVQCKAWRTPMVGVDVVREFYDTMTARQAAAGFVVTSGRFNAEASAFARERHVVLIHGTLLHALIRDVKASDTSPAPSAPPARKDPAPASIEAMAPSCALCTEP